MTALDQAFCVQCALPLGRRPYLQRVIGELRGFCCYGCGLAFQVRHGNVEEAQAASFLVRLGVGTFFSMNVMMLSWLVYSGSLDTESEGLRAAVLWVIWLLATPAVAILSWPFARAAWQEARGARLGAPALAVLGVVCAYVYSSAVLLSGGEEIYLDTATMVLLLFTVGRYLEASGRAHAARDLTPMIEAESRILRVGEVIRVAPGERIAVDGVVLQGRAYVDEAVISGDNRLIDKGPGAHVVAGSVSTDGHLWVRCEAVGADTRWGRICRAVRRALSARSPLQGAADHIAAASVPIVLAVAGGVMLYGASRLALESAFLSALAVLVVACPCALGLATPLATALGVARLARQGCVVRDGSVLETLARIRTIVFDKTGTLTSSAARVAAIEACGVSAEVLLSRAAGLAHQSRHALGRGMVAEAEARGLRPVSASDVCVAPGRGVMATAGDGLIAAGSETWLAQLGFRRAGATVAARARSYAASGFALVHVGWAGQERGVIAFEHELQPEARETVSALRGHRLHTVLVSGDLPEATRRAAESAGVDEWRASITPEGKAEWVTRWQLERGAIAMVGDGINDGLALTGADVGISFGSADALARETAELVLPPNGLALLPWAIELARATRRTIVSNLAWAFGYNIVAVTAAASGLLQPILAAALMAGSSLLVIANSMRLRRFPAPGALAGRSHEYSAPRDRSISEMSCLRT